MFKFFTYAISLIAVTFIVLLLFDFGEWAEEQCCPVYKNWRLAKVEPGPRDGTTNVWIEFDKVRRCDYLGLSWYWGDPVGGYRRSIVNFNRPRGDRNDAWRPLGKQFDGPWTLSIPLDRLLRESAVEVHHRCHPMWVTHTQLMP